jgi:hypothetical protein
MADNRFFAVQAQGSTYGPIQDSEWKQEYLGSVKVGLSNSNRAAYKIAGVPGNPSSTSISAQPALQAKFGVLDQLAYIYSKNNTVILIYSYNQSLDDITDIKVIVTVKPEWAADPKVDPDIKVGPQEFSFIKPITQEQVNILVKQINIAKFIGKRRSDVESEVNAFIDTLATAVEVYPQFSFAHGVDNSISDDNSEIEKLKSEIKELEKVIDNTFASPNEKNAAQAEINKKNDKITFYKTSVEVKKKLATPIKAGASKLELNINKFVGDFKSTIMAVYDAVEPDEAKATEKKKQNDKLRQERQDAVRSGLAVDKAKQTQEALREKQLVENQIIELAPATGANEFTRTVGLDKATSILDVLRSEESISNFKEKHINVKTTTGSGSLPNQDDTSVCKELLSKFSATDIQNMIKSIDDKITANNTSMLKNMIDLKKMQSSGGFQFMAAFSGFGGVDFSNPNLSFPDIDFASIKNGLVEGIKSVKDLTVKEISSEYGQVVATGNDLISNAKATVLGMVNKNMNAVDFNAVLKNVDTKTLSKCPTLSALKKNMQNPGNDTKNSVDSIKNEAELAARSVNEKISSAESIANEQKELQAQKQSLLDLINSGAVK